MMKKTRFRITLAVLLALALALSLAACGSTDPAGEENGGDNGGDNGGTSYDTTIRVGSKDFTESLIVAEIYALALEDAGFPVDRRLGIAGSTVHAAIVNGEIDLYPEYTGTGLLAILQLPLETDPMTVYEIVKEEYDEQFDITWLNFSSGNNGQGLVIRTEVAEEYDIYTISDLQEHAHLLRFCTQGEFDEREDGLPGLIAVYGPFDWLSSSNFANAFKYEVLRSDQADVAPAYTTDGELANPEFTLLEDDKHVWPPYNLIPIVRNDVLDAYPEIADILNHVSANLDTETLTKLNAQVDVDKREADEVAIEFFISIK